MSLVVGLVGLALAGRAVASENQLQGFVRFHENINPTTFFYPTASEVVAVARAAADPDRIPVIVGGSSIVYGWGQGTDEVWSGVLQQQLGDRFGVVNLALPFGVPAEHSGVAAQALLQEGRAPIFVAEAFPNGALEPDGQTFRYVFWDGLSKGLVPPLPERDAILAQPSPAGPAVDAERQDLRLRSALDRVLYFTDFWQAVAYRAVFTLWYPSPDERDLFLTPRSQKGDPRAVITPDLVYPPAGDERAMATLQSELTAWCAEQPDGSWQLRDTTAFWASYRPWLRTQFPDGLRERSLLLVIAHSPYYTARLPDAARRCWQSFLLMVTDQLNADGYRAVFLSQDWTADDFIDVLHPSGSGGRKMAAQVAPLVRQLADRR